MASKSPNEAVKAFMAAMEKKDYTTALQYVADSCACTNAPMSSVKGSGGVRAMLEPFFAPVVEQTFIIKT